MEETAHRRLLRHGATGTRGRAVFLSDGLHSNEDIRSCSARPGPRGGAFETRQPTWRNPTEKHKQTALVRCSIGSDRISPMSFWNG